MTRLKKLLVAGLMAIVTCCVSLGSAIVNISQSIFNLFTASADSSYKYKNDGLNSYTAGKVLTVKNIVTDYKLNEKVSIPTQVVITSLGEQSAVLTPVDGENVVVEIVDPDGDSVVSYDNNYDANQVSIETIDGRQCYTFNATKIGSYKVQYAAKQNGVWTLSDIYNVNVVA